MLIQHSFSTFHHNKCSALRATPGQRSRSSFLPAMLLTSMQSNRIFMTQRRCQKCQLPHVKFDMQTRQVGGDTLLEACIENYSKGPMVLEYVRFDAAPHLAAISIDIRDTLMTDFTRDDPLGSYIDQLQVLPSSLFAAFLARSSGLPCVACHLNIQAVFCHNCISSSAMTF